jgi:hydrogenase small subunit
LKAPWDSQGALFLLRLQRRGRAPGAPRQLPQPLQPRRHSLSGARRSLLDLDPRAYLIEVVQGFSAVEPCRLGEIGLGDQRQVRAVEDGRVLERLVLALGDGEEHGAQILPQVVARRADQVTDVLDEEEVQVLEIPVRQRRVEEGYWSGFGTDPATGQPITTSEWLDRLAPKALAVLAVGTCATYGGIHAMAGNPTGAMGVPDYLGWSWKSKAGLPIVCVPGCPIQGDNLSETILYLLYQATGQAPMIPLDEMLRPTWLFGHTVHEGCDRAGYYEQGDFAHEYGSPKCIVKLGCWGPVVKCNVPKRGWINGVGGCPNVGGICIGCTMPGFPDKFMPFMDEPPGATVSTGVSGLYGGIMRGLRGMTARTVDKEPKWRHRGKELATGYEKTWQ